MTLYFLRQKIQETKDNYKVNNRHFKEGLDLGIQYALNEIDKEISNAEFRLAQLKKEIYEEHKLSGITNYSCGLKGQIDELVLILGKKEETK